MPIILLGLIVILGITLYALISYGNSVDDEDARPVSERFYDAFESIRDRMKKGANYTIVDDDEEKEEDSKSGGKDEGHTLYFPTDAEVEKRKRDIH